MEAGFILLFIVVVIAVVAISVRIGIGIGRSQIMKRYSSETQYTQGILNVDCSDPAFEPGLFLGLAIPVTDVVTRKYIVFDVNVLTGDSRK